MPRSWLSTEYSVHQVQRTPSTVYTRYSVHQVQRTPSTAYSKYSIHQVQRTPSTAYTQYCIHPVLHTPHIASSKDQLSPAPSQSVISRHTMLCSILYIPTITSYPTQRVPAPVAPPSRSTTCRLTASKYSFNLARSWPPSASRHTLDHGIRLNLQCRSITGSKCAQSWPPSEHLESRSKTGSKWDSKLALSRPRMVSPISLDYGIQVRTIIVSKCISNLGWLQPPSSNDHGL